jgi:hypothetical protein
MKRTESHADFIDHIAQRDEIARPLGHPDRLAVAVELDQLAQQHGELGIPGGHGPGNGFEPLDVTAMIGAEHIDHFIEAALELVA